MDPRGPSGKGGARVVRGGGYFNDRSYSRVAYRGWIDPDSRTIGPAGMGFRLAVER